MSLTRTRQSREAHRLLLFIILAAYLLIGTLYALETPAWQAPDEPAHFNYVKYIAENRRLPELNAGDYPAEYLEEIKAARFPPDMSIEPIRYESHQPPLYYLAAAAVYRLADVLPNTPHLIALRLLSLVLSAGALATGYAIIRRILPDAPLLALGTVAFAATLPMHIALSAAVNSDSLAILLVSRTVLALVSLGGRRWTLRRTLLLGILLGLAFLTKMQSYVAFGVALAALGWDATHMRDYLPPLGWRVALGRAALMLGVALAIATPWLLRNVQVYGLTDPLAMARHDAIVEGQLTTAEYVAQAGLATLLQGFAQTTFRSFWGQFGWMGVVLDERIYRTLMLVSAIAGVGFVLQSGRALLAWRASGRWGLSSVSGRGLALLGLWLTLTTLGYLWWNLKFVQHQGRYLFPALVPIGLAYTAGWREVLSRSARAVAIALALATLALLALAVVTGDLRGFSTALLASGTLFVVTGAWLERRAPGAALALLYSGMAVLSAICLYVYIVPWLTP
jgi:4-amino-4-deoxy-L-arabinose transferase-like glycosyltransferase